jgi:hypothetical protein
VLRSVNSGVISGFEIFCLRLSLPPVDADCDDAIPEPTTGLAEFGLIESIFVTIDV